MTNPHDELLLQNLRCPHCGAGVKSIWNLETTGMVVCMAKCKGGRFNMKPEDCIDVSDEEEDLLGVGDLEEIEGGWRM